jgi:hypothetical protein
LLNHAASLAAIDSSTVPTAAIKNIYLFLVLPHARRHPALGPQGPPAKMNEGYFRFFCPHCGEIRATINPRNNLAHCFCCKKNLNTSKVPPV